MNYKLIWFIFKKDLVEAIRDGNIMITILFPIIMSLFLGLFLSPESQKNIIVLYNPDHSLTIYEQLKTHPNIQVLEVTSVEELKNTIQQKKAAGGLALPKGYDSALNHNQRIEITAFLNQQAGIGEKVVFQQVVSAIELSSIQQPIPVQAKWVDIEDTTNRPNEFNIAHWLFSFSLLINLVFVAGLVVPLLLVAEKEKHTMAFLLASPASSIDIVFAKALTGMTYSLLTGFIIIIINREMLTNIPMLTFVTVLGAILIVLIGLMLGTFCQSSMQVNSWASLIVAVLSFPILLIMISLPAILESGIRLIPTFYFINALNATLAGDVGISVWIDIAILFGSIIAMFAMVAWSLRRENSR